MFRANGFGLVVYHYSLEQRTGFIIKTLREIAVEFVGDPERQRREVFRLSKYVHDGFKRLIEPNPFAGPDLAAIEPFDLADAAAALQAALPPQEPPPKRGWSFFGRRRSA